jgi:predicted metal-dependent hydrolase
VAVGATLLCLSPSSAQSSTDREIRHAVPSSDISAQRRIRRRATPIYIYGRSGYLPPTAVRTCNAWYEQEFRPSGTVIVPRMRCVWVNG